MDNIKKEYRKPQVIRVSLVPEEAVLVVCKNHLDSGDIASNLNYCSWAGQNPGSGQKVCKGVTGS